MALRLRCGFVVIAVALLSLTGCGDDAKTNTGDTTSTVVPNTESTIAVGY